MEAPMTEPLAIEEGADPTARDAACIVSAVFGEVVESVTRFPTGSSHFVYDVRAASGRGVVVRISRRDGVEAVRGAVYWSRLLRPKGVPLPELLYVDLSMTRHPFPAVVLERLAGRDLGLVYQDLSRRQLRALAERLAHVQGIVTALPPGRGFGYAADYDERIRAAGLVDEHVVDSVESAVAPFAPYFDRVAATPFLHDITTKNVIVHEGRLSGIVDVDDLCFGDPLLLIALIRTAVLAHGHDPVYVHEWLDIVQPGAEGRAVLDLYTLLHCVDFMGELGQRFNRSAAAPVDPAYCARLQALYTQLLDRIVR
jgi:Ser/Thr protein kinase RdoA (MazF antagonist)